MYTRYTCKHTTYIHPCIYAFNQVPGGPRCKSPLDYCISRSTQLPHLLLLLSTVRRKSFVRPLRAEEGAEEGAAREVRVEPRRAKSTGAKGERTRLRYAGDLLLSLRGRGEARVLLRRRVRGACPIRRAQVAGRQDAHGDGRGGRRRRRREGAPSMASP